MEQFISKMLVLDIIPILVVMILGYLSGKKNVFEPDQARVFNKLVLNFALPAALFTSIVRADRAMLMENSTLTIVTFVGLISLFMLAYLSVLFVFKRTKAEAAVGALIVGSPTVGFFGIRCFGPVIWVGR